MRTIFWVARKEAVELFRDGRFRWGTAILLGLLAVAVATGASHYHEVSRTHEWASETTYRQWLEQGSRNPHVAAHYGMYAFRPTPRYAVFDRGVYSYVGVALWLEAHWQNPLGHPPARDGTALMRMADLTAAGALQLFVPLLIILLGFSAFSGERETGTLRQLLSQGAHPVLVAWGKVIGILGALLALLIPAAVLGGIGMWFAGLESEATADPMWPRLVILSLVYLGYFVAFVFLVLVVSALAPSSRTALALLLGFWVFNGLIAPRMAADLARLAHPLPSAGQLQGQIRSDLFEGFDGYPGSGERNRLVRDSVLQAYGASSPEELPINISGVLLQAGEDYGNLVFDRRFGDLRNRLLSQVEVTRRVGAVAPFLAIRSLSMALAGTDVAHTEHFRAAGEEHRRRIQRIMNEAITFQSRYGEEFRAGPDLWRAVPEFEYQAPRLEWALTQERTSVLVLAAWVILGGLILFGSTWRLRAI